MRGLAYLKLPNLIVSQQLNSSRGIRVSRSWIEPMIADKQGRSDHQVENAAAARGPND